MMFKIPFFGKKEKKEKKEEKPVYVFEDSLSSNALANRAYEAVSRLSEIGPRLAATKNARMAANNIASRLESFADDVEILPFLADRSRAYLWTRILAFLLPISSLFLLFGLPYISLILNALSFLLIYFEAIEARGLFSRFFKKEEGENVKASIRPELEEESVVILSAHHDSAFLYNRKDAVKDIYVPLFSLCYLTVLSLFLILHEALSGTLFSFNLPSLFPFIFIAFGIVLSVFSFRLFSLFSTSGSPGVGDNLSGVGVLIALSEYFSKRKLKRTRIEIVSFDAEEAGCQGSRDYYGMTTYPENTININIDGLYNAEELSILTRDGNGLVGLDEPLAMELSALAKSMGYKFRVGKLSFFSGATDSSSASLAGIRSVCITGMAPGFDTAAHTSKDTIDKVEKKSLEAVISLIIKYIESKDKSPLDEKEGERNLFDGRKYKLSPRE